MRNAMRVLVGVGMLSCAVVLAQGEPDWREGAQRFGVSEAPAKAEGAVRIATYNLENLFDDVDDPATEADDTEWFKPEVEQVALAEAIRKLDADILALQEVESEGVLREFRDTYLKDMGYEYLASIDGGDARGIEQSVLSRFPIVDAKVFGQLPLGGVHPEKYGRGENWLAGQPMLLRRSPLMVRIEIPPASDAGEAAGEDTGPYELTMFVLHHKSGGPAGYWREAEAKKVVELIAVAGLKPTDNVVICGDFNAQVGEGVLEAYTGLGFREVTDPAKAGTPEVVTHESGRSIDHLLVSPGMLGEVVGPGFVLGTLARPEGVDWREFPPPEGYASDHYPVAVDIRPVDEPNKK